MVTSRLKFSPSVSEPWYVLFLESLIRIHSATPLHYSSITMQYRKLVESLDPGLAKRQDDFCLRKYISILKAHEVPS